MGINGPIDVFVVQIFMSIASFIHIKIFYIGFFFIVLAIAALNDILTGRFNTGYWGLGGHLFTGQSDHIKNTFSFWIDILIFLICGSLGARLIIAGINLV